ncbi:uridine kinase [miscellaneous Crenarchaeota group archaeon SMTZ-80]|nr:MAG: uridine kinase [miscellaneous Crenarchaeota group archaeon SMTZ-80]
MKKGILIGISGASGSGKTLVAQNIYNRLGSENLVIIQEDSYYKDLSDIPFNERADKNFDHPHAFDHDLLYKQLCDLLAGKTIFHPIYDYNTHSRRAETRAVEPHAIIVLEGILILNDQNLCNLMDIKVFIDTEPDICFIRRLKRDIDERGRDVNSVIKQYIESVRPMYKQFIEPSKRNADIIIPQGGKNEVAIDILTAKIESLLKEMWAN